MISFLKQILFSGIIKDMISEYKKQSILSVYLCPKIFAKNTDKNGKKKEKRRDVKAMAKDIGVSRPVFYKVVRKFLQEELKNITH